MMIQNLKEQAKAEEMSIDAQAQKLKEKSQREE